MCIQFQIEEMPGYLAVRFTGATRKAREQFEVIAEFCDRASKNKLLLDFTYTHGELSFVERFLLGAQAETFMFHNLNKVAVVGRPDQLDCDKFGEMVARNRWVNARVFTSLRAAKRWLSLKPATSRKRTPRAIIIPRNLADHGHY
jgi:hypothetical protein